MKLLSKNNIVLGILFLGVVLAVAGGYYALKVNS
jgi:hypothetical protein